MSKKGKGYSSYWLWIFLLLSASSCTKKTCPAYFSTFNHSPEAANEFFSYFKPEKQAEGFSKGGKSGGDVYASSDSFFDSPDVGSDGPLGNDSPKEAYVPTRDTLKTPNGMLIFEDADMPSDMPIMQGHVRGKNGLVKKNRGFLSQIFGKPAKKRTKNTPKIVKMKTKPEKRKKGEEADSASAELPYPPEYFDQFYYEVEFGGTLEKNQPVDSLQQETPEGAEGELEEGYEYVTDKKGRLKKKKIKKKNRKKKDDDDASDEEVSEEPKKKSKKGRKKDKKKEEGDNEEEEGSTS